MTSGKRADAADIHVETNQYLDHLQDVDLNDKSLNAGALEATAQEHSIGFVQGFKTYRKAAFWSFRT